AHRLARPPRHRAPVRARARARRRRGHPRVRLSRRGTEPASGDPGQAGAGPERSRYRRRGPRILRRVRIDLRARRAGAARPPARPDRHPGALPRLRGLGRGGAGSGRDDPELPQGRHAGSADARGDHGRHPHPRPGHGRQGRRAGPRRPTAQAHRRGQARRPRGRAPAARRGAGVVRPGVRRGPLDAAAHRAGRRRGPARPPRRALRAGRLEHRARRRARGRRLHALRLRRAARAPGGEGVLPRAEDPRRPADRRRRRVGLVLATRPAVGRRPGVAGSCAPSGAHRPPGAPGTRRRRV
ncbi:MAG: Vitamin B12 ABC transporter, substrate-binding protein BtuF, partial [uncultured Solirubrobacteraceae bacterium]